MVTLPNALSALRLASVPVFVWLYVTGYANAAVAVFAVAAVTDFFDGYIARRWGVVTELGKILDPLADRVIIVALAVALVVRDLLPWSLAVAVIARDVFVLLAFPLLESKGIPRIRVNFVGKTATAALLLGLGLLALSETTFPLASGGEDPGLVFVVLGAVLYWAAGAMYLREAAGRLKGSGDIQT